MSRILDKKIPSILGILLLVLGVTATTFLVKGNQVLQINANPTSTPENIEITNVSDNSFTVVYVTKDSVMGTLNVGEDPQSLDQVILDDRDKISKDISEYKTHSITVDGLTPETNYYFQIRSGNNSSKNTAPLNVKTGPKIISNSLSFPISGKVINSDGSIPNEGIVILLINDAQKLSTYLTKEGKYTLPLNNLRTTDLNNIFDFNENVVVNLDVKSDSSQSLINISNSNLKQIPIVTLSNNYNFSKEDPEPTRIINSKNIKFPEFKSKRKTQSTPILKPSLIPTITTTP